MLACVSCVSVFFSASDQAPACASHGCQFKCAVTHDGPQCYCSAGYEVAADGKTCKGERETHSSSVNLNLVSLCSLTAGKHEQAFKFASSSVDFNECNVYGTCSQTCANTEGSYTCSCVEGYLLQPDNRSCKAKNGENTNATRAKMKMSLIREDSFLLWK